MPREILHWDILERASASLKNHGELTLYRALTEFKLAAYLGAVVHDAPYYVDFGRNEEFKKIAECLHGSHREDTFDPIRHLAAAIIQQQDLRRRNLLWSFLMGMISHVVTDVYFHPLVCYFTGNYYDPIPQEAWKSQARHRLFEVYLDSWFSAHGYAGGPRRLSSVLRGLDADLEVIVSLLDTQLIPERMSYLTQAAVPSARFDWRRSIKAMAAIQDISFSSILGAAVRMLNFVLLGQLSAIDALFSFARTRPHQFFNGAIDFKNPASGEARKIAVIELRDQAVAETASMLQMLRPLLECQSTDIGAILGGVKGKSLNVGIYKSATEDYIYFAEEKERGIWGLFTPRGKTPVNP